MDLTVICVVGFIVLGIYKLFELFAKRKERLLFIEKLAFISEDKEDEERRIKVRLPFLSESNADFGFWPLRVSLLLIGIGAGCLSAFFIRIFSLIQEYPHSWELNVLVNFASILMFGGVGLLVAFLIEQKIKAKKNDKNV